MAKTLDGPTWDYENHTPHDTNVITQNGVELTGKNPIKGFCVNATGDVVTINSRGNSVTHYGVPAGVIWPARTTRILAAGTTATQTTVYFV